MRITSKQLAQLLKKKKGEKEFLIHALQRVFSYKKNIDTFATFFFPEVCTHKSPKFHSEIYKKMFMPGNYALAAPRGHGKSSVVGLIFLIFCIVNKLEKYIVYISQNHVKTVQFLSPIRHEFKNNNLLQFVYGNLSPRLARDDEGKDREDCFDVNGCRVEAVSFEKNLRGFKYNNIRPTLIIGDDIEEDMRVLNPELRVKDEHKLNKVIIPSLDIDGRFKMIGTLLHYDSLLYKKIKQYKGITYKACDKDWKNLLWADRFTKQKLQQIKKDIGSIAFQQEYLNDPIDTTASLIRKEWIQSCFRTDLSQEDLMQYEYENTFLGVDFAFSDRVTADRSAFVSVGERDGHFYLMDCRTRKGLSVGDQMKEIKYVLHRMFDYDMIGLEENSIRSVSKDLSEYNLPITLFWTAAKDSPKQSKPSADFFGRRYTIGKIQMLNRIGVMFENKKIVIPYKTEKDRQVADELLSECTSYALSDGKLVEAGVHPDIPIGLGYALESARTNVSSVIY